MARAMIILAVSLVVAVLLALSLFSPSTTIPVVSQAEKATAQQAPTPLLIYCAASNRAVMEAIAKDYQAEYGVPIEFQFGPSQTLLSSIETSQTGDLYLPADSSYLDIATKRGTVTDLFPLARMHVVLGVPAGNPRQIRQFSDLLQTSCRLVQANPDVAAVGKLTRNELLRTGQWNDLLQHTIAFVGSVTEAANSVKAGAADVAILYDAVLTTYPELEMVQLKEFQNLYAEIKIGLISSGKQQANARHFIQYLTSADHGLKRYREFGFAPVTGDALP